MTRLDRAIAEAVRHLETHHVPYMIFGGVANLRWGRPRLTEDLDIKVDVAPSSWANFIEDLSSDFSLLPDDPIEFARDTHVLPVDSREGVRIDLVFASLAYEREAIARAVAIPLAGILVRCCTAEDLILHKILSERPRDHEDVEGVVIRQGKALDRAYLDPRVDALARDLERPEILELYRECLRRAGLPPR